MKRPRYVLDSYALLAYFQREAGGAVVKALLERAAQGEVQLYVSLINLGELAYLTERRRGTSALRQTLAVLDRLALHLANVDRKRVLAAALVKAHHPISYADAFAAALAQELEAPVVTGNPEFHKVEDIVQVLWLERDETIGR